MASDNSGGSQPLFGQTSTLTGNNTGGSQPAFGQTSSSTGGGIFGSFTSTPAGLGQTSSATSTSVPGTATSNPPSIFGTNPTSSSSEKSGLFSNNMGATSGLFSNPAKAPTKFNFGTTSELKPPTPEIKPPASSSQIFGSSFKPSGSPLFNLTTSAASTGTSTPAKAFSLSDSTTPVGPPPKENDQASKPSIFVSAPIFGEAGTQKSNMFNKESSSIFATNTSSSSTAPTSSAPSALSDTSKLFGSTPNAPSTSAPSLGSTEAPKSNETSASAPAAATTTTATSNLFKPLTSGATAETKTAAATSQPSNSVPVSSTVGPTSQMTRLKNKTMDEIITRWASDLSKYQKDFQEQAGKVAAWDRLMVENGDKIQKLYLSTYEAERQNAEIERQLLNVENQQDEVASWLDKYENEIDEMFSRQVGQGDTLQGPDQERERTYKLAERLTDRLDEMGKNLASMIDAINDASSTLTKTGKPDDPLSSILRVLNNHLTTLQWIDENAENLKQKIGEAQKSSGDISLPSFSSFRDTGVINPSQSS